MILGRIYRKFHLIKRYISTTNFPGLSILSNVTRDIEQPNKRRKKKMKRGERKKIVPFLIRVKL